MLSESVTNLLKNSMWDLATCANGESNVVPVAFKDVTNDGKIAISAYDAQSLEGYQMKGTAEYVTEGNYYPLLK